MPTHTFEKPVDIRETLASGQTFLFSPNGDGYAGIYGGHAAFIRQNGAYMQIDCPDEDLPFWRRFFDMDRDYREALGPWLDDESIGACFCAYGGLRLMRQPVWETLCSFIVSANNHQRRIERILRTVARLYGQEYCIHGIPAYTFPAPDTLAALPEEALRLAGAGYRAPYLIKTARAVAEGFPLNLDDMEYQEALKLLMTLYGVGEKVADCVLLFASRHSCAFPVDVWMERVMSRLYGLTGTRKQIKEAACRIFGENAGIVQQLLFHGARSGILQLEQKMEKQK